MSLYQASKVDTKKKKKKSSDVRKKSSDVRKKSHHKKSSNASMSFRLNKSSTSSVDYSSESSVIKQLRRDREKEQLMRLKANQKLALLEKLFSAKLKAMNVRLDDIESVKFDELQKRLQQTESIEGQMTEELDRLKRENNYLKKKQKGMTRKSPLSKKSLKLIKNNIDEKSRDILTSNQSKELFEGIVLDYSRKQKTYLQRVCKLTNDGELLFFKGKNSANPLKTFDLISVYTETEKSRDSEFELISNTKENRKFRTETEEETDDFVKYIKVVQYYFKVKASQFEDKDSENESENENSESENDFELNDEKEREMEFETEKTVVIEEVKIKETDPFWLDVSEKMDAIKYEYIKEVIPDKDAMDPLDKKNNKWKDVLWKADYGQFELSCSVQLVCYDTGKWTDDENNILFGSISKYGLNSNSSWEKIADNLNRTVKDVMKQYSKLVNISVKQLKKMAVARG